MKTSATFALTLAAVAALGLAACHKDKTPPVDSSAVAAESAAAPAADSSAPVASSSAMSAAASSAPASSTP